MARIFIFCEGQTEETFVREILTGHFARLQIWVYPILLRTGPGGKGGVVSYQSVRKQLVRKCRQDPSAWVTTFIDFYGLPSDFPFSDVTGAPLERVLAAEENLQLDVSEPNFIANITANEFEGLLFSKPAAFGLYFSGSEAVKKLQDIRDTFPSPEHINDGKTTAPSKRIQQILKKYDKVLYGSLIALEIGLDAIRKECRRFDSWISKLENLKAF